MGTDVKGEDSLANRRDVSLEEIQKRVRVKLGYIKIVKVSDLGEHFL